MFCCVFKTHLCIYWVHSRTHIHVEFTGQLSDGSLLWDATQVIKLGDKCLNLLSYLTSPKINSYTSDSWKSCYCGKDFCCDCSFSHTHILCLSLPLSVFLSLPTPLSLFVSLPTSPCILCVHNICRCLHMQRPEDTRSLDSPGTRIMGGSELPLFQRECWEYNSGSLEAVQAFLTTEPLL